MNKNNIVPVLVVVLLVAAWAMVDRFYIAPMQRRSAEAAIAARMANTNIVGTGHADSISAAGTNAANAASSAVEVESKTTAAAMPVDATPTQKFMLSNDCLKVRVTSRGAAIEDAELTKYDRSLTDKVNHVELDFSNQTALAYAGINGLSESYNFLAVEQKPRSLTLERQGENGLVLRRTITLGSNYVVAVSDEFSNRGNAPVTLPHHSLRSGLMMTESGHRNMIGFSVLGVDALPGGSEGVKHWGGDLPKWFDKIQATRGGRLPESIETAPLDDSVKERSVDWIAAKNKYFVQIIAPEGGADGSLVEARRSVPAYEKADPTAPPPKRAEIEAVGGTLQFTAVQTILPGQSLPPRNIAYFVGPKKYEDLRDLRGHQVDVMELGYWRGVGKILLSILNFIHDNIVHNYGIAIMLLTVIVRGVFWTLTHKITVNMKRMAKLQPEMQRIREKYKGNPQKTQSEIMAMYKENKVNPVAGCLPMVIQIPVFIALFVILRSAIELRYASFLWIRDLSEPERIFEFGFTIPFLGWDALNILPLAMAGTMYLQMKITPSAGDPQQQKIMMTMMPVMMVFMLYNYAAGLALYWTTTNLISIGQQIYYRRYSHDPLPPVAPKPTPKPTQGRRR